jgi:hypothetical protein
LSLSASLLSFCLSLSLSVDRPGSSHANPWKRKKARLEDEEKDSEETLDKVFLGQPGPLCMKEIAINSPLRTLLRDFKFEQVLQMATIFNFMEPAESTLIGSQKVTAQLEDSEWSKAFNLDSAGVNQVLSVKHPELGRLELAFRVLSAPGRLAQYTKIVRFSPRFVVMNRLKRAVTIHQFNEMLFETNPIKVSPEHLSPFHLPTVFGERQVAIDVYGPWTRSVPFEIDKLGSYTFRLRKIVNPSALEHISTRGNPEYIVPIPSGELGIWFETDWNHQQIVVMKLRPESYVATHTDVQAGDVLLAVDGVDISQWEFEKVMKLIKSRSNSSPCSLTFRTVEETMRIIRDSTLLDATDEPDRNWSAKLESRDSDRSDKELGIRVEMRAIDSMVFMIISSLDSGGPEYRVENRSSIYTIFYRQKGVHNSNWCSLSPGHSSSYIWEDPTKPHRLMILVGPNILCPSSKRLQSFAFNEDRNILPGKDKDTAVSTVLFDEIGFTEDISIPGLDSLKLTAIVESEGPTKVLVVSPKESERDSEVIASLSFAKAQLAVLETLETEFQEIIDKDIEQQRITGEALDRLVQDILNSRQKSLAFCTKPACGPFESLLGPVITKQNTIILQVIEVTGLKTAHTRQIVETYCDVKMITGNAQYRNCHAQRQKTYTNDETVDAFWVDQIFLFDVPVLPTQSIRGYNIRVKVKSKSIIGPDSFLGQADIQFSSLLEERELNGWFPLKPKEFSISVSPQNLDVNGSIKLRLQWIYSPKELMAYLMEVIHR